MIFGVAGVIGDKLPLGGNGGIPKGYQSEVLVKYKDTTHYDITAGLYEVDGLEIEISADIADILVTSPPAGFDFIYVYANKSLSGASTLVSYNDTAEPVKNLSKKGWYHPTNTSDRILGVLHSPAAGATIAYSKSFPTKSGVKSEINSDPDFKLADAMIPNGAWQTPNLLESGVRLPVNAIGALIKVKSEKGAAPFAEFSWIDNESASFYAVQFTSPRFSRGGLSTIQAQWGPIGASRNIKIFAASLNVGTVRAEINGWEIER